MSINSTYSTLYTNTHVRTKKKKKKISPTKPSFSPRSDLFVCLNAVVPAPLRTSRCLIHNTVPAPHSWPPAAHTDSRGLSSGAADVCLVSSSVWQLLDGKREIKTDSGDGGEQVGTEREVEDKREQIQRWSTDTGPLVDGQNHLEECLWRRMPIEFKI